MKRLLLAMILLLATVIGLEARYIPRDMARPPTTRPSPPSLPDIALRTQNAAPDYSTYREIAQRPLFSSNRKPPKATTTRQATTGIEVRHLRLLAIIRAGRTRQVLLRNNQDGKLHTGRLGERVLGWDIGEIQEGQVILRQGGIERRLQLWTFPEPEGKAKNTAE